MTFEEYLIEQNQRAKNDLYTVKTENYTKGYAEGYPNGEKDGFANGYEYGKTDGYNSGVVAGKEQGIEIGIEQGKNEMMLTLNTEDLTELTIPEGITKIRPHFYTYSSTLKTINLPEGLTTIGGYAFTQNANLQPPVLPNTLETIETYAFSYAYSFGLKGDLVLPPNLKTIGAYAFGYDQLFGQDLIIPASVETIDSRAFIRCFGDGTGKQNPNAFTKIYFKGTPTSVATDAFLDNYGCCSDIYCPWAEGEVANAPWGATVATIHYNYVEGAE